MLPVLCILTEPPGVVQALTKDSEVSPFMPDELFLQETNPSISLQSKKMRSTRTLININGAYMNKTEILQRRTCRKAPFACSPQP